MSLSKYIPHKKFKWVIGCITLITVLFCSYTLPVQAYTPEAWKLQSKSATFVWGSNLQTSGSVIRNGWENAISDWYRASSASFTYNSNSTNVLNSWYETSSTYFGRGSITYNSSTYYVTSFTADINSGNTTISQSYVARSTGCHEFGHILGIDDLTSGTAIMNVNRDRSSIYIPQTDDMFGINAKYSN